MSKKKKIEKLKALIREINNAHSNKELDEKTLLEVIKKIENRRPS